VIEGGGLLPGGARLQPIRWHELGLEWRRATRQCRVQLDGREIGTLPLRRETTGACYLRLRATAQEANPAGLLVESVEVEVSAS